MAEETGSSNSPIQVTDQKIDRTLLSAVVIAAMVTLGVYVYVTQNSKDIYQEVNQAVIQVR
jgi:hypothetical protein